MNILKLMRVKHYLKNMLIFLPLIFSANLFNGDVLLKTIVAFFAFCMAASIVYIINDIKDVSKDRLHPTKKNRPLASGCVKIETAYILIGVLSFIIIGCFVFLKIPLICLCYILIYIAINVAYSFGLKNIPIVDVVILTSGFLIRVLYGGAAIDIDVSNWLYLTVISFAFYFSLGKRRNELSVSHHKTRKVLEYYSKDFLDKNMYMCLALGIVFYSLWSMSYEGVDLLVWTVPLAIIITMKYSMNIETGGDGDPIEVVYSDKILLLLILIYVIFLMSILYLI